MAKWYCQDCGETFDESEIEVDRAYEYSDRIGHGGMYWDDEYRCPHCGSEDIDECEICDLCGEYFPPSKLEYVGSSDFHACEDCRDNLRRIVKAVVEDTVGEFEGLEDSTKAEELLLSYIESEVD